MEQPERDPEVVRYDALEDLQHALIVRDSVLRRDAEKRLRDVARVRAAAVSGRRWKWTNPSVLRLAEFGDPVDVVLDRARDMTLAAMAEGWGVDGPPFDPVALAAMREIAVEPLMLPDSVDAQLISSHERSVIQFNPTRPASRRRFSVAHELAHTLFEDYAEGVRTRSLHSGSADEWQLEMLCNIAAGEILMPAGSFEDLASAPPALETLLSLRERFGVSTEAILNRVCHLSNLPLASFVASPAGRTYRLDYVVGSRNFPIESRHLRRMMLPAKSVVERCRAIGETAKSDSEIWAPEMSVQCVALPPYRGSSSLRVAGLLQWNVGETPRRPSAVEILGDATRPQTLPAAVVFVVNDKARTWYGGFANALRARWPNAQSGYTRWFSSRRPSLGEAWIEDVGDGVMLIALVAQSGYGPATKTRLRYDALRHGLARVADIAANQNLSVHMPRIGSGEARASWPVTSELIEDELVTRGIATTIYALPGDRGIASRPAKKDA